MGALVGEPRVDAHGQPLHRGDPAEQLGEGRLVARVEAGGQLGLVLA